MLEQLAANGYPEIRLRHERVLSAVDYAGTRLSRIAGRLGITRQSTLSTVRQLEEMGYLTRQEISDKPHAHLVAFTEAGSTLLEFAFGCLDRVEQDVRAKVGEDALETARAVLVAVTDS